MGDLLQVTANGIIAGSLVALLAVSYSLIYGILRFVNFAFGEIMMMAGYFFFLLRVTLGLPTGLAIAVGAITIGLGGALVQVGAYRPFYRRSRLASLITALSVSIIVQNLALLVFEGRPLSIPSAADQVVRLGHVAVTKTQITIFMAGLALLLLTDLMVFRTVAGLRLRALADNL